jgi:hypothetical protein
VSNGRGVETLELILERAKLEEYRVRDRLYLLSLVLCEDKLHKIAIVARKFTGLYTCGLP